MGDELYFCSSRPGGLGTYDIYVSRFTGLTSNGFAGITSTMQLLFSDPASSGLSYYGAASFGSTPGIPVDTRVIPLNVDLLLLLSLGGFPPIFNGYVGVLDANGVSPGSIAPPNLPAIVGLQFVNAFVVLDPSAPSGIRTISNALEVKVL
jgi:hypothetical protein